jgi:hypothetical protein
MKGMSLRKREERRKVLLRVRLRSDTGWSDVLVRNISRRGMLISADPSLKPGAYIEIRRARYTIVARVVWSSGNSFGLRTQDPIDVDGLIAVAAIEQAGGADTATARSQPEAPRTHERRAVKRVEHARQISSHLQFGVLALALAVAAWLIASEVSNQLARPLDQVRAALGGSG